MLRTRLLALPLLVALAGCGSSSNPSATTTTAATTSAATPGPADDLKTLQGAWTTPEGARATWTFEGDKISVADGKGAVQMEFAVVLDAAKNPKAMDLFPILAGTKASGSKPAVYAVDGDTLTIRMSGIEKPSRRPASVKPKRGDDPTSMPITLQRVK